MISDNERREVAERMRKRADDGVAFVGTHIANAIMVDFFNDRECWNRLEDLIDPDNIPDNADENAHGLSGRCDRDALLAVADDLGKIRHDYSRLGMEACAYFGREVGGCETCEASKSDDPCLEQAIDDVSRRIRDAVDACEGDSDAPMAGDREQTATDAHMDDSEAAEGYHRVDMSDKFNENIAAIDFVRDNGGLDAVKARMMPEGMEWPRFEDGEPARIGDEVKTFNHGQSSNITSISFDSRGAHIGYRWNGKDDYTTISPSMLERPQVLAADGEPLEAGQTVWTVDAGIKFEVHSIEGDTVWGSLDGDRTDDGLDPKSLTHERPDSWELLEEDAGKNPFDYCKDVGHRLDTCENSEAYKARDLVRRARALAGVSE